MNQSIYLKKHESKYLHKNKLLKLKNNILERGKDIR